MLTPIGRVERVACAAMVTKMRSKAGGGAGVGAGSVPLAGGGAFAAGSGGSSEGHRKQDRRGPAHAWPGAASLLQWRQAADERQRDVIGAEHWSDRWPRPARPEHVADIEKRQQRPGREHDKRQQQRSMAAGRAGRRAAAVRVLRSAQTCVGDWPANRSDHQLSAFGLRCVRRRDADDSRVNP